MSPHRPFISMANLVTALIKDNSVIHRVTYMPGAHPTESRRSLFGSNWAIFKASVSRGFGEFIELRITPVSS